MSTTENVERELKFEAGKEAAIPSFDSVEGVDAVDAASVAELHATYFDTSDLALARHKITLRHRTGGGDEGWHLKLPSTAGARAEVHAPLSAVSEGPPSALTDRVRIHVRDKPLIAVAEVLNRRTTYSLRSSNGAALVEVVDDRVTASSLRPGHKHVSTWREWEAEIVSGDESDLARVRDRLLQAGALDSPSPSKLARALGPDAVTPTSEAEPEPASFAKNSIGALLVETVARHRDAFFEHDALVRLDKEDAVHQMRVAARRIRSLLRGYRPQFARQLTDPIERELKWCAGVLGGARDAEVMALRLDALIAAQPTGTISKTTRKHLLAHQRDAYATAYSEVMDMLTSPRYFRLLDSLDTILAADHFSKKAKRDGSDAICSTLVRMHKKTRKTEGKARAATNTYERDTNLHSVRKECKRIRYAAEIANKTHIDAKSGRKIKRVRKAAEDVQEVLGEHQDGVITRNLLDNIAVDVAEQGGDASDYQRLAGYEQAMADVAESDYRTHWKALRRAIRALP
ncbi:CYTH and CHAD domain-containing protein [Hoyosella rhizosphaerae]|uniref:CHAD domain-containing protein n=1 Tax=Hoyosella rhizosphaerae TaxID=1755582 RepID=A0A916UFW1_9ACTN|nr:CYTH and CHAD domain-containing protein [Hoyosella rhizosphaerae]MBN4927990.1 CYTH and CHAD domain-containing protein [Hoyosella rhizosphaerae]GGC71490.1 CHAD domain-containing protein [Hoyosella rhizosphaerae]